MLVLPEFGNQGDEAKAAFIRHIYFDDAAAVTLLIENLSGTPYWVKPGVHETTEMNKAEREPRVFWQTSADKRLDLAVLDLIETITKATLNLSSAEYTRMCRALMPDLIRKSPLFRQLSQVRSAKHDEPVTEHILSVIENLPTDGLPEELIRILRMSAWKHDLGKIIDYLPFEDEHLLKGDFVQLHALLSVYFDRMHALNKEKSGIYTEADRNVDKKMRLILRLHHIYELVSQEVLTNDDFDALVPNEIKVMLALFSVADSAAVEEYSGMYDLENLGIAAVNSFLVSPESTEQLASRQETTDEITFWSPVIIQVFVRRIEIAAEKIDRLLLESAEKANKYAQQLISFLHRMLDITILSDLHNTFREIIGKYSTSIMLASAV